ncbi:MAG: nitrous oxide reductase family maturation protein NosD [Calditrichaeota bacterium]|nr:nitrous oxide reductase family maturation protein NosD [Calditrichota bacterium]RQV98393.1 MAG: nitrous oxide reductase family maturation protein NosD [Calditrichota bacterium]
MRISLLPELFISVFLLLVFQTHAEQLIVSESGKYFTISSALENAQAGDTILVKGGIYSGSITIDKPVVLIGKESPVIDGSNNNTLISINAPSVTVRGFVIQNSGKSLSREDAGISVNAEKAVIENNHIRNVLFGVYLRQAHGSIIRNSRIAGKPDLTVPRRGDLIRAWYSDSLLIEENELNSGRDVIIWFSTGSKIVGNRIRNARYGLHFMYSNDCHIERNQMTGNSVGAYLMYSRRLHMKNNIMAYNRGPSGFGIGLKDLDDGYLTENLVVDNRVGIFIDNSPREIQSTMHYAGNIVAYNDMGIEVLSTLERSIFRENSFIENYQQASLGGSRTAEPATWRHNYWSDYAGYDLREDGYGDIPYKSQKLFEDLLTRHPLLRVFIYTPAVQAVDFAAQAFPVVKPRPMLSDSVPLMFPRYPAHLAGLNSKPRKTFISMTVILILSGIFIITGFSKKSKGDKQIIKNETKEQGEASARGPSLIEVRNLTKKFGSVTAIKDLSFSLGKNESLALWGANGAGKTTVLRCLLGIVPYQGRIKILGMNTEKNDKTIRSMVGFVPQEIDFYDNLNVEETLDFFAMLRRAPTSGISDWLRLLELHDQQQKKVKNLSGGMKQRLALAIALLGNPPFLFLDEPTASLDIDSRRDFIQLLKQLKKDGKSILFSSHRLEEVSAIADRVLILEKGKLVKKCRPFELTGLESTSSMLKIFLEEERIASAITKLNEEGFKADRNNDGIKVIVDPKNKARPISLLASSGIFVRDFDFESNGQD